MLENPRYGAIAARNEGVCARVAIFSIPQFTGQGLELGAGSIVARALTDQFGSTRLDLDKDFGRAAALLSVAYHRPVGAREMGRLQAASEAWAKNDLTLAHTILAQAKLGRLEEGEDAAERLLIAEKFLDDGTAPYELLKALGLLAEDWPLDKASPDDLVHPGWPAGTSNSRGGKFKPKNTADDGTAGVGHNQGPSLDTRPKLPPPPDIPKERPDIGKIRTLFIKAAVRWLARWLLQAGLTAARITAPEVVIPLELGIEVGSWAYPYVKSYFDGPKSLKELQDAVDDPQQGYEIHHTVEQTPAEKDGFSRDQIDGRDNLVRIPTLKHWELNGWYQKPNPSLGGLTPRQYIRGKDWAERQRIGLIGLRTVGVLVK